MPEENARRSGLGERVGESRVAGVARRGLGAAGRTDGHRAHEHGVETEGGGGGGCGGGDIRGSLLQPVVDDDRSRSQPEARCLERGRRGERERVRSAAECDEHERAGSG